MQQQKPLPADVFDTIELISLVNKGIGAGQDFEDTYGEARPCCVFGQVVDACNSDNSQANFMMLALYRAGIDRGANDNAVRRINSRNGRPANARVGFWPWVRELNAVRVA